jgi:hypothetical protein
VAALAEVLACDQLLMYREDLIKGFADEFEGKKVRDTAVGEYCDLEFDRKEIPRGGSRNWGNFGNTVIISALARSGSYIRRVTYTDSEEEDGNTLCLDVVRFSFSAFFLRLEARALFTWDESRCIRELIIK